MKKIFAFMFLLCFATNHSTCNASGADVIVSTKKALSDRMKDPDSIKFKNVFSSYTDKGGYVACGQLNSKNSFGAYMGFKRFIGNGKTTFIEGIDKSNPEFPKLWAMLCLNKE